jgi:hypothetical protein
MDGTGEKRSRWPVLCNSACLATGTLQARCGVRTMSIRAICREDRVGSIAVERRGGVIVNGRFGQKPFKPDFCLENHRVA